MRYNGAMKPCLLCKQPTQSPDRIHTPCLYAYLYPLASIDFPMNGTTNN